MPLAVLRRIAVKLAAVLLVAGYPRWVLSVYCTGLQAEVTALDVRSKALLWLLRRLCCLVTALMVRIQRDFASNLAEPARTISTN